MMNKRLASIGLQRKERGGAGNCFCDSAGAEVGMSGSVLREQIAEYLKCNRDENGKFICESFEEFCKGVATNGIWVNGGPEVFAAPKVLDRDILILGRDDPAHDLFFGTRGTEPIILVYWEDEKYFTGVEIIEDSWRKVGSKGFRSEQQSQFLKNEFLSKESERNKVIMQARSKTVNETAVKKSSNFDCDFRRGGTNHTHFGTV